MGVPATINYDELLDMKRSHEKSYFSFMSTVSKGLKNLEIEKQEPQKLNHKIESQSRKNLQTQVARIKQTIEKAVDKATFLSERIIYH